MEVIDLRDYKRTRRSQFHRTFTLETRDESALITISCLTIGLLFVFLFFKLKLQRYVIIYFILSVRFCKMMITNERVESETKNTKVLEF